MELKEMITKRKSVRSYTAELVDAATIQKIYEFIAGMKPLYPEIRTRAEVVGRESVRCILPWTTPQLIAIFSEERDEAMENAGFMFQQLDLYLQSIGLGVCWLGMGKLNSQGVVATQKNDDLECVMLLAFGYPKGSARRESVAEFKRKSLAEISDQADERLEAARLAPSSVNSQPWYFVHEGENLHVYCAYQSFLMSKVLSGINRIDIGIALAHMYLSNPDTFRFFQAEAEPKKGYHYMGTFVI